MLKIIQLTELKELLIVIQEQTWKTVYLEIWFLKNLTKLAVVLLILLSVMDCGENVQNLKRKGIQENLNKTDSFGLENTTPLFSEIKEADSVELKIISKVINDFYLDKENGVIFLINETNTNFDYANDQDLASWFLKRNKIKLQNSTLLNFKKTISNKIHLGNVCVIPRCYLKSKEDAEGIFTDDAMRLEANQKYPLLEGAVYISRVGFNEAKDQALVYRIRYSGPKSGVGEYVALEKISEDWVVKGKVEAWLM